MATRVGSFCDLNLKYTDEDMMDVVAQPDLEERSMTCYLAGDMLYSSLFDTRE